MISIEGTMKSESHRRDVTAIPRSRVAGLCKKIFLVEPE
jgi:hypothetical protein